MTRRATRYAAGVVAVLVASCLVTPLAAFAAPPEITDDLITDSIQPLDPAIQALNPAIEPVETIVVDGPQTVISLQGDILFDFGTATISPAASAKIAELVAQIPQSATVGVGGHTDSVGDDASNLTLSQQRAQAVADVIAAARGDLKLTATGYGETQPVAPNAVGGQDDPVGRAANRRVAISYTG